MERAWTLAIEALSWTELKEINATLALSRSIKQLGIKEPSTIATALRLVKETERRKNFIDKIINHTLAPRSIDYFKLGVQAFLRLYTYQTKFAGAGREEAIVMAQIGRSVLGWRELSPVEEILGKILSIDPKDLLSELSDEERVGLKTFHPTWFVRYCIRLMGRSEALRFLRKNVEIPPTYIRINTLKGGEEAILGEIEKVRVSLEGVSQLPNVYRVMKTKKTLTRLKPYRDGLFFIQDKSSCLAVEVADPKPGSTVIDLCAAPGAKTTHIAQKMGNRGKIYSIDYSARRMFILRRELERTGVKIVSSIIADACKPLPVSVKADLLVLDPPCSSTGSFWKMPSAKWRIDARSVRGIAKIQWMMINSSADNVKVGGSLVYSTCSVTLEENEVLIERFLKWHPEFELVETRPRIGLPGFRSQSGCQRIFPHIHEANGFFIAKLVKVME